MCQHFVRFLAACLVWCACSEVMDLSLVRRAVVDSDLKVIGMLNDRDICMAAYTRGVALVQASVDSVMSREACVCTPSDNIPAAAERMRERQLRCLPVIDDDRRSVMVSDV